LQDASVNTCYALQSDLKHVLGTPRVDDKRWDIETWEDKRNNNDIDGWRLDKSSSATCGITYRPLSGPYRNPGESIGLTEGQWIGYRECGPSRLQVCEDSNELFYGLPDRKGRMTKKTEFPRALRRFIGSARYGDVAYRLTGPGLMERLADGYQLFAGFVPHAATAKGAVVFDTKGEIVAVGELDVDTHSPCSGALTVFTRNAPAEKTLSATLIDWARVAVSGVYGCLTSKPPVIAVNVLVTRTGAKTWKSAN
jgi:hypothetical protein